MNYATLFDSAYLSKGLALRSSLQKHAPDSTLYILALDVPTARTLADMGVKNVVPIAMLEQDRRLSQGGKTRQEYFWMLASQWTDWVMDRIDASVTYIDADLFFFSDPSPVFEELKGASVGITPHRFALEHKHFEANGKFNVGFVYFNNDATGKACLKGWAGNCRAWCRYENAGPGLFADQGYLDNWQHDYGEAVHVIEHLGVNLGPWSVGRFDITEKDGAVYVNRDPLICFHYHEYLHGKRLTNWPLRPEDKALIYAPYIKAINESAESVSALTNTYSAFLV